ncbi:Protein tyrosine phosphatase non-receptor type 23, partial [Podarcis lilfordi]
PKQALLPVPCQRPLAPSRPMGMACHKPQPSHSQASVSCIRGRLCLSELSAG